MVRHYSEAMYTLANRLKGLITSYSGLIAARFFLGLCEGVTPRHIAHSPPVSNRRPRRTSPWPLSVSL